MQPAWPIICSLPRPSDETITKQPMQIHPEPTNHHSYQHHRHTTDNQPFQDPQHPTAAEIPPCQDHCQPFQDHHRETTTDSTNKHTFQDHTILNSTTSDHHYFQDHHTNTKISSQDHISSTNRHKDTIHSKYSTICSYHNTDTIQPDQQRPSTANNTLQPEPTITDKRNIIWR